MIRLTLTHLTFIGTSVPPATVEFGPQLTLVRGPSDTGKSFIANAIDFMLGATTLKEIPERAGYSTVLLGLRLADGDEVTLARPVNGGPIGLHLSDIRDGPLPPPDERLAAKHNPRSEANLSRYLLRQIDLDGKRVRKNARNETDSLSFRNLAHLCLVDETQMQSDTPPALTGNFISKTKEVSVLKLLLQNDDDSHLVANEDTQQRTRMVGARVEVIDRLLAELEQQLSEAPDVGELRDQLARVHASVEQQGSEVSTLGAARSRVTQALQEAQNTYAAARSDLADIAALQGRFALLDRQYDSDLQRLAAIDEAGTLLGFFTPGVCAFCGAEPEHQHYNADCEGDDTALHASVTAETDKTAALRADLRSTLDDLAAQQAVLRSTTARVGDDINRLAGELRGLDTQLAPHNNELRDLLAVRTRVEKSLGLYEQVSNLERMKAQVADESDTDTRAATDDINLAVLREFSAELSARLTAWQYNEAGTVRYDRSAQDIQSGDQFRSAHGKGVRAILHAAFTISLAQYCIDRDIPHPGFVVLDSPLVTYRAPDADSNAASGEDDDTVSDSVVEAFYRDLQTRFEGQVIVMENLDPPSAPTAETFDVPFTKRENVGRYGFFPLGRGQSELTMDDEGS